MLRTRPQQATLPSTMIVAEREQSDAASPNTLITTQSKRIPPARHYLPLIFISCIVSLLCFCFVLDDIAAFNLELAIAAILADVLSLSLPYQGAAILLYWLHRHQTDSIFPFTPSPRAIVYGILLIMLWAACTIVAAIRLNSQMLEFPKYSPTINNTIKC